MITLVVHEIHRSLAFNSIRYLPVDILDILQLFTMLEDEQISNISRLLVQQDSIIPLDQRSEVYDSLGISHSLYSAWDMRFQRGEIQMYELNKRMLNQWRSSKGKEASLHNLITKFQQLGLLGAAG